MIYLLCGLQDEASIFHGHDGLTVLCGAAQRDRLGELVPADCTGLVSAGCAGALSPALAIGALTVAADVMLLDGTIYPALGRAQPATQWAVAVAGRTGASLHRVFSCPTEQCATAAERAALRTQLGADVVDEESFAVAQLAQARNIPFLVLRAISDAADQTILPGDAKAQRPDGTEDVTAILGDALADPAEAIREADGFGKSLDALRAAFRTLGPGFGLPA